MTMFVRLLAVFTALVLALTSPVWAEPLSSPDAESVSGPDDEPPSLLARPAAQPSAVDRTPTIAVGRQSARFEAETGRIGRTSSVRLTAEDELAAVQAAIAELEKTVAAEQTVVHERLSDAYMNPATSTLGYLLGASDLNRAVGRLSLLRALADEQEAQVANLRSIAAELSALEATAAEIAGRVETLRTQEYEAPDDLGRAKLEQLELQVALGSRIEQFHALVDGLDAAEPEVLALLARTRPANAYGGGVTVPRATTGLVTPAEGEFTSDYGPRWGRIHKGIDIAANAGTPIHSVLDGVVLRAERSGGYGNNVILDHGDGFTSLYGHMRKLHVVEGQRVIPGQLLGEMGSTGSATGPHLHLELRFGDTPVDPEPFLIPPECSDYPENIEESAGSPSNSGSCVRLMYLQSDGS